MTRPAPSDEDLKARRLACVRVEILMRRLGWKQVQLADALGRSHSTVGDWIQTARLTEKQVLERYHVEGKAIRGPGRASLKKLAELAGESMRFFDPAETEAGEDSMEAQSIKFATRIGARLLERALRVPETTLRSGLKSIVDAYEESITPITEPEELEDSEDSD